MEILLRLEQMFHIEWREKAQAQFSLFHTIKTHNLHVLLKWYC